MLFWLFISILLILFPFAFFIRDIVILVYVDYILGILRLFFFTPTSFMSVYHQYQILQL